MFDIWTPTYGEPRTTHNLYSHVCVDKTSPVWCEVVVVSLRGEIGWHGMV